MAKNFTITMDVKRLFFDAPGVVKKMDAARRKNLSQMGAFIRRRARSSLRKRKKAAGRGQPPSVHSSPPNLRTIYFVYERGADSVVVGPVLLRGSGNQNIPAPSAQEHGGAVRQKEWRSKSGFLVRKRRVVKVRPHPFMGPALDAERDNFPDIWRNSVRP